MAKRTTSATLVSTTLLTGGMGVVASEQDALSGPMDEVNTSAAVVQEMLDHGNDLDVGLDAAHGIFVMPNDATADLLVGGSGGAGVLFDRQNGQLGNPVFYDVGGLSVDAQAGVTDDAVALLLMSEKALEVFNQETGFSVNSEAGLEIVNWSAETNWSEGKGDVVMWSPTEGLLGEAAGSVSDIRFDAEATQAYYDEQVTPQRILAGEVRNPHAGDLRSEFSAFTRVGGKDVGQGADFNGLDVQDRMQDRMGEEPDIHGSAGAAEGDRSGGDDQ